MNKILMVALMLALIVTTINAFPINTSQQVDVYEQGVFYVEITNDTQELKDLEINFYSPAEVKINAPSKIAPNTNMTAQIKVYNKYETYREMTSKLEVKLGNETETKEVTLRFYAREGTADNPLMGLFGLGSFSNESSDYSIAEWAAFGLLVLIAAILLIALVARVKNRM